jgi:uncharacterized protein (DUF488 family)
MKLYTIGHSNHPIEQLMQLLKAQGIAVLVDVRSTPYSRHNPQFYKDNLQQVLLKYDIEYLCWYWFGWASTRFILLST